MGWCLFPVPHGVIFAHNIVDFRELDAYSDKTVIVIDINNTPLDSIADCCGCRDGEEEEGGGGGGGGSGGGLSTYTEIRFNPKPDRRRGDDTTTAASNGASARSNVSRPLSNGHLANGAASSSSSSAPAASSSSSSSSSPEDNRDRSSNTEAYLPPPPVDDRTIVYKTQKRFSSAVDVVDLLKSIESYQVF